MRGGFRYQRPDAGAIHVVSEKPRDNIYELNPSGSEQLTLRERQVLRLIGYGKSTKETAVVLGVSFRTASCHRYNIMNKLCAHNAADLTRHAVRMGLVEV